MKENRQYIQQLLEEKKQNEIEYIELMSNRKLAKIPLEKVVFIESLADYIQVNIENEEPVTSKEKISKIAERLPANFIRIHRSFIVNTNFIQKHSYTEIEIASTVLNIGRTYQKTVKERLSN